jgi:hypothetical protein
MHLRALALSFQPVSALLESHTAILTAWYNGTLQHINISTYHALLDALDFNDLLCNELESRGINPKREFRTGRGGLPL